MEKWSGKREKGFLFDGPSFEQAFEVLLGSHTSDGEGDINIEVERK